MKKKVNYFVNFYIKLFVQFLGSYKFPLRLFLLSWFWVNLPCDSSWSIGFLERSFSYFFLLLHEFIHWILGLCKLLHGIVILLVLLAIFVNVNWNSKESFWLIDWGFLYFDLLLLNLWQKDNFPVFLFNEGVKLLIRLLGSVDLFFELLDSSDLS